MQCDKVWDLLSAFADGETDARESTVVQAHIAVCADCARDLQFMQGTQEVLHALPEVEPPISLRSAILAATVNRPTLAERFATAVRRGLAPAPVRYGALAAAGAAAALTAVTFRDQRSPVDYATTKPTVVATAPPSADSAAESHGLSVDLLDVYEPSAERAASQRPRVRSARMRSIEPRPTVRVAQTDSVRSARPSAKTTPVVADARTKSAATSDDLGSPAGSTSATSSSMPADPEPSSRMVAALPEPSPAPGTSGKAASDAARSARIVLTASSVTLDPTQVATLADLRRSLGQQAGASSSASDVPASRRDRQIRVDVLRGSF